jgi:pSer/pThr/pTyr-binding forkhead associated (FHA) protein
MPLRLRVIPPAGLKPGDRRSPSTERLVEFADDVEEIRIGRRADVELSLPFLALSGLHARLRRKRAGDGGRSDAWMIEDLDSKNGTFVNGIRLHQGEQRLMLAGIEVDLAHVRLVFDGHSEAAADAEGTATIARRLVSDLFLGSPGASAPTLTVVTGTANVSSIKLVERERRYLVGRSKTCDLNLKVDELSREHASFTRGSNGVVVRDLGSKNGILVNGLRIKEQRLADGDLILMGPLKLRLTDPEDRYLRDLEANQDRPPAAERPSGPVPRSPAPAPAPAPMPAAAPTPAVAPLRPATVSRLAASRSPAGAAPTPEQRHAIDEMHPAIATRRSALVEPQRVDEPPLTHRPRIATFVAAFVLATIVAVAAYLIFGGEPSDY